MKNVVLSVHMLLSFLNVENAESAAVLASLLGASTGFEPNNFQSVARFACRYAMSRSDLPAINSPLAGCVCWVGQMYDIFDHKTPAWRLRVIFSRQASQKQMDLDKNYAGTGWAGEELSSEKTNGGKFHWKSKRRDAS